LKLLTSREEKREIGHQSLMGRSFFAGRDTQMAASVRQTIANS
jgi:hypothetical protein